MHRPPFIVIEGIDGVGKSTLIRGLERELGDQRLVTTREPSDWLRRRLINLNLRNLDELSTEFINERGRTARDTIRPSIAEGKTVISDRYEESTLAYQGYGRGASVGDLLRRSRSITNGLIPDITLLLDLPCIEAVRRLRRRGQELEEYERDLRLLIRARWGYLNMSYSEPERHHVINAAQPVDAVLAEALGVIRPLLPY